MFNSLDHRRIPVSGLWLAMKSIGKVEKWENAFNSKYNFCLWLSEAAHLNAANCLWKACVGLCLEDKLTCLLASF